MASFYLVLAIVLAIGINLQNRWLRAASAVLIALCLVMIIVSIQLANFDGTFAAIPAGAPLIDRLTPAILNAQAALAGLATVFLFWAAKQQLRRHIDSTPPMKNTPDAYGRVSRFLHWTIAVLVLCLVPIGLFMAILPASHPERAAFVAAHQGLGLTVLALLAARVSWFFISRPPGPVSWSASLGDSACAGRPLGNVSPAVPISGERLHFKRVRGCGIDLYGWSVPLIGQPGETLTASAKLVHNWVLPLLFYAAIALHVGAVLFRHFKERRRDAVRRMLR